MPRSPMAWSHTCRPASSAAATARSRAACSQRGAPLSEGGVVRPGGEHRRRVRLDDPVDVALHAPERDQAVAGAVPEADGFREAGGRVVRGEVDGQPGAHGELAFRARPLEEGKEPRHLAGRPARVLHRGDPRPVEERERLEQQGVVALGRRFGDEVLDEAAGRLLQGAGRLARLRVAHDRAVQRVLRLLRDPGQGEGPAVGPAGVAVVAVHVGRPVGDDRVELLAGGQAARERPVDPAPSHDPRAVRVGPGELADPLLQPGQGGLVG